MTITIRAFGIAREICGAASVELDTPDQLTAGALRAMLMSKYPRLEALNSFLLAVDESFAEPDTLITPKDEIAIIPPVSGG